MRSPEVTELQRILLEALRGEMKQSTARRIALMIGGIVGVDDSRMSDDHYRIIRETRRKIQELDPDALLYERWGGPMPPKIDRLSPFVL